MKPKLARATRRATRVGIGCLMTMFMGTHASAQLTDIEQTPNALNAGIQKSYTDQIGAGRGDEFTMDSSLFIIKRDPFRAIRRGRQIFQRKFTIAQGNGPRTGDGVGPIGDPGMGSIGAGLADSCAACHGRPKGTAGFGGVVVTRPDSRDSPHLFGLGLQEMLADEITQDLRQIRESAIQRAQIRGTNVRRRLRSKGISYGRIIAHPDGSVDTSQVRGVNEDLRVRPFFAEGTTVSIREFLVGAFNAEMGLESPDPDLLAATDENNPQDVVTPAGMVLSGTTDELEAPPALHEFDDPDGDGVVNEIPVSIVDHMEFYLLNYFKPGTTRQTARTQRGRQVFASIGCTECHIPDLRIEKDRRVADVDTRYNPQDGEFNQLFATATPLFVETNDNLGLPTLKTPALQPFLVKDIYTDFRRHDLGPKFWERNYDGTLQKEFMTEPLWGVGSTAPYGHDGRSINLDSVIRRHGGEAEASSNQYAQLSPRNRRAVLEFLDSLVLFPPDDTASNLNPKNPQAPDFPQNGHGSINLSVLFNDPTDLE